MMTANNSSRRSALALIVALLGLALLVGSAGLVTAGDSIAIYEFEDGDEAIEASAGDVVELDLYMQSDGGYSGEGLQSTEATVAVDESVATITDIDHGPWIESDDDEIEVTRDTAIDGRSATVYHNRTEPGDGAVGYDRFFTLTVELEEDAPAADVVVDVIDAEAVLVGGFPIRTIERETVIAVDGGGDRIEPSISGQSDDDDDSSVGVTTASETDRPVDAEADDDSSLRLLIVGIMGALGAGLILTGGIVWLRQS